MNEIKIVEKNTLKLSTFPPLRSLLNADNIAICFFGQNSIITGYSSGFEKLLKFRKDFFIGKKLAGLPFSKIDEMLGFPSLNTSLADFQTFKAVKFINGHGQISSIDLHLTLARQGNEITGGTILLEKVSEPELKTENHYNLLSKSEYYLKEPLRISTVFAKRLKDSIEQNDQNQSQEYVYYVAKNLKKLNRLLDHLVTLENLNPKKLKKSKINTEVLWLLELQKASKAEDIGSPKITMNQFPEAIWGDKDLMRKMLNLIIEFAALYPPNDLENFIEFSGEEFDKTIKLYFAFNKIDFIEHPKFSVQNPLNKVADLNNLPVSGYELVLINQIVLNHGGELEIQLMKNGHTLLQITLPRKSE